MKTTINGWIFNSNEMDIFATPVQEHQFKFYEEGELPELRSYYIPEVLTYSPEELLKRGEEDEIILTVRAIAEGKIT